MKEMSLFDEQTIEVTDDRKFYLMNKDTVLLEFVVVGDGLFEKINIIEIKEELPSWIKEPESFIRNRKAPKQRENIEKLLEESGCDTILGYLQVTHALSLVDTFWVKNVHSTLTWKRLSLYINPFNEVIAKTAFDGGLHGRNLATTSPEYGTDGSFAKCWIRENNIIKLMKRGSSGARNAGLEPFSEFYISQIARELQLDHVDYSLRSHNKRVCSVCNCFTSEEYGYLPYAAVERVHGSDVLPVLEDFARLGLEQEFRDMMVFDAVVFNEDRHKGNFGFIVNNETYEIQGMAPLFDHNIALFCYAEEEQFAEIEHYLREKGPKLGRDFVKDAKVLLTASMKKKLINLRGFRFERDGKLDLPEWRLELLEKTVNKQIDLILQ